MAATATTGNTPLAVGKRLRDLTSEECRKIAASYGMQISGVVGTTGYQVMGVTAYAAVVLFFAWLIPGTIAETFHLGTMDVWLVILAGWVAIMGLSWFLWFVNVSDMTGLMVYDKIFKVYHVFIGWGLKNPWETYLVSENFYNLQVDFVKKTSKFLSAEGVDFTQEWSLQFSPFLPLLPLYVRTEARAIEDGLEEVVIGVVNGIYLTKATSDVRSAFTATEMRNTLVAALEGKPILTAIGTGDHTEVVLKAFLDPEGNTIEQRFGIDIELSTFSAPSFNLDYVESLVGSAKGKQITEDAKMMKEKLQITGAEAIRQAMILNKEQGVTDQAFTVRAGDMRGAFGTLLNTQPPTNP